MLWASQGDPAEHHSKCEQTEIGAYMTKPLSSEVCPSLMASSLSQKDWSAGKERTLK